MMRYFLDTSSFLERCFDIKDEVKITMRKREDPSRSLMSNSLSAPNLERAALSHSTIYLIMVSAAAWLLPSLPINVANTSRQA